MRVGVLYGGSKHKMVRLKFKYCSSSVMETVTTALRVTSANMTSLRGSSRNSLVIRSSWYGTFYVADWTNK